MLILSRKKNEEIDLVLPDGVVVKVIVVDIRSDKVRLGVDAPTWMPVHRKEVFDAIQKTRNGGMA